MKKIKFGLFVVAVMTFACFLTVTDAHAQSGSPPPCCITPPWAVPPAGDGDVVTLDAGLSLIPQPALSRSAIPPAEPYMAMAAVESRKPAYRR